VRHCRHRRARADRPDDRRGHAERRDEADAHVHRARPGHQGRRPARGARDDHVQRRLSLRQLRPPPPPLDRRARHGPPRRPRRAVQPHRARQDLHVGLRENIGGFASESCATPGSA
jgi:hypothetical protein